MIVIQSSGCNLQYCIIYQNQWKSSFSSYRLSKTSHTSRAISLLDDWEKILSSRRIYVVRYIFQSQRISGSNWLEKLKIVGTPGLGKSHVCCCSISGCDCVLYVKSINKLNGTKEMEKALVHQVVQFI